MKLFPMGSGLCACAIAGVVCLVAPAEGQVVTLTDGNSAARIDVGSSAGMFDWSVQGQSQLAQQWFWYRLGDNPEAPINTIGAPTIVPVGTRGLSTTYAGDAFSVRIDYLLTGGSIVPVGQHTSSDITEAITINNTSLEALHFHFFQYSDFNLSVGNDVVQLGKNIQGYFNEAYQHSGDVALTETVTTPGASHGEAALYDSTLGKLNDASPTILNDQANPVGPGDVTWAFQWDFDLAPGGTFIISKDKYLNVTVVPEPSSLAFIGLGLAALVLRTRRSC